jgi:hypothetical protein
MRLLLPVDCFRVVRVDGEHFVEAFLRLALLLESQVAGAFAVGRIEIVFVSVQCFVTLEDSRGILQQLNVG